MAVAALLRPGEVSKLRRLWNLGHWWLGRAALLVALGNLFFGLRLAGEGLLFFLVLAAVVRARANEAARLTPGQGGSGLAGEG